MKHTIIDASQFELKKKSYQLSVLQKLLKVVVTSVSQL